ncbi:putative RNA-directed DNA polymerase from transposon BS [Trichonephila clavipes]|nr:putative RNA-directed DNA polymerase from transposon BS [Trichonephila clavipes]
MFGFKFGDTVVRDCGTVAVTISTLVLHPVPCYGDYNRTSAYLISWTNRHRLKRDSPFSRMQAMDLLDQDIEEHFLKNVFNPQEGLPRVHFKSELGAHTSKNQDPPEYLRQLALEIINKIPATAMQIYTDGSKDEQNSCGSGIFIKAPNCSHNIKIRNSDFCSVFRSELIAIDEALRIIKTMTSPDEIWILCDSRSAIQHLSDWTNVGDKTSVSILKNLKELSQQHEIYFQWIPSHIGLFGNDTADLLAKEGVTENLMSRRTLTFSEIFSKTKSLIQELWKTPPTHPWYNRQAPGGALSIKADRVVQTTISRLASGHIRGLSFNLGQKIYENCTKCNLVQATLDHLLFCAGLEREDIYSSPLLVYDFLRTLGLMDLFTCRNCGGGDKGRIAIYRPFGEVSLSLNRTVTCMVLKANDRRTSCPCHDEFRGPRSDYVRQVALATTTH